MKGQKHKVSLIFLVLSERLNSLMNFTFEVRLKNKNKRMLII